jgi:hypothetical protein
MSESEVQSEVPQKRAKSIFLYGRPGDGKTSMIRTITGLQDGSPCWILDLDCKVLEMENLRPYIEDERLIVTEIPSELVEDSLAARAAGSDSYKSKRGGEFFTMSSPKVQPRGYVKLCELIDSADSFIKEHGVKSIAVDCFTTAVEHLYRLVSFITKKGTIEESAWNMVLMNEEELLTAIKLLPVNYVIVTAHSKLVFNEESGMLSQIVPAVQGDMKNKIIKFFTEAYLFDNIVGARGIEYRVRTRSSVLAQARTSRFLNEFEPADFRVIFDKDYRMEYYAKTSK